MPPDSLDVSRETEAKFSRYLALLTEWQQRFNLVAPSTLAEARQRHVEDSAQLAAYVPQRLRQGCWVDMGSGAGFPGLVVALLLPVKMHLIESTGKKCAFLSAVSHELGIADRVTIHNARAETMKGPRADIISARACAPLVKLFDWGSNFAASRTLWLLPKGRTVMSEIEAAKGAWRFDHELKPSLTDPEARIVIARNVAREDRRQTMKRPEKRRREAGR